MMQQCCACGEAKYQLTFKGLWSAQTHRKDYPSTNGKRILFYQVFLKTNSLAHFSTTVGAVHNSNYSMFDVGSYANRGLSQFVLTGETHTLEQELANEVSLRNEFFSYCFFSLLLNSRSNVIKNRLVHIF